MKKEAPPDPKRSAIMARVRGKNTRPEIAVRRIAHQLGYRFRLHRRDLPGTPDLVFPSLRKVIFVHGCFWHRHIHCSLASIPRIRVEFWQEKFAKNIERDASNKVKLREQGWDVQEIWQCETLNVLLLRERLTLFLGAVRS